MSKKYLIEKDSVYIGGGYSQSQLIWLIPLVHGYCHEKAIKNIIFEKILSSTIFENTQINTILAKYNTQILKNNLVYRNILFLIFFLLKNIIKIIFYSLTVNRKQLLRKKTSWFKIQILHGIWDTSFLYLKDGDLSPDLISRIKAAFRVYFNIFCALLLKKYNTDAAFITHCVYGHRGLLASLRENNVKIINCDTNCTVFVQPREKDLNWNIPDKKIIQSFFNKNHHRLAINYWNKRIFGLGNYEDAQIAIKGKILRKKIYPNVIMMHIFRDSPFNLIDRSRIFSDYIDWIYNTLMILKDSNERWLIRGHPNFLRWGENSKVTFDRIYNKVFGENKKKNIDFSLEKISNIDLLSNAKRLVTFSGTSHLEFACLGRKPIVVSKCTLESFDKDSVLKPKNLNEYKKFLLDSSYSDYFKISDNKKKNAKLLLYLRENILNFRKELHCSSVYRNDKKKYINKNYKNISKNLPENINYLNLLGKKLANNFSNVVCKKFINFI
jgi:hypothetical protein